MHFNEQKFTLNYLFMIYTPQRPTIKESRPRCCSHCWINTWDASFLLHSIYYVSIFLLCFVVGRCSKKRWNTEKCSMFTLEENWECFSNYNAVKRNNSSEVKGSFKSTSIVTDILRGNSMNLLTLPRCWSQHGVQRKLSLKWWNGKMNENEFLSSRWDECFRRMSDVTVVKGKTAFWC